MSKNKARASIKSPLRYPGGKTRAIKMLEKLQPCGVGRMLSPFIGGGSFELHVSASGVQVDGFDVYAPLVNFWKHALSPDKEKLMDTIEGIKNGMDKASFKRCQEELSGYVEGTVELAAYYYAVNRSSFSGSTLSGGYSPRAESERFTWRQIDYLRRFEAPNLRVGEGAFENTLMRAEDYDFIFLDPPYDLTNPALYGTAGDMHKGFPHLLLADLVRDISTPWLMTYNDTEEVRARYAGFNLIEASWAYGMNKSKKSSELIITNYPIEGEGK